MEFRHYGIKFKSKDFNNVQFMIENPLISYKLIMTNTVNIYFCVRKKP